MLTINEKCNYCDEILDPIEELEECPECEVIGHSDCIESHYFNEHDREEGEEMEDSPDENYEEGILDGTEQDF